MALMYTYKARSACAATGVHCLLPPINTMRYIIATSSTLLHHGLAALCNHAYTPLGQGETAEMADGLNYGLGLHF